MATAPACSSVIGWTGTFMVTNQTGGTLYAAPSSSGTSFFKHTLASDSNVSGSEAVYLNGLASDASSGCVVFATAGGADSWYFQYATQPDGSGVIQGSLTMPIPQNDTAIVMVLTPGPNGSVGTITSYPSGWTWTPIIGHSVSS